MRADRTCLLSINQRPQLTIVVSFSFESKQGLQHTGLEKARGAYAPRTPGWSQRVASSRADGPCHGGEGCCTADAQPLQKSFDSLEKNRGRPLARQEWGSTSRSDERGPLAAVCAENGRDGVV